MTAPVVANVGVPIAEILINAVTGGAYRINAADAASVLPIPNYTAPLAIVLVDPTTGVAYRL